MEKQLFQELKTRLEKEKNSLEAQLRSFAQRDRAKEGDWDTKFPRFNSANNPNDLEGEADEMEEYENLRPVENVLETRLRDVDSALKKISQDGYGRCEKCGQEIAPERLLASPEAKFCDHCKK